MNQESVIAPAKLDAIIDQLAEHGWVVDHPCSARGHPSAAAVLSGTMASRQLS
jgi:hypothetical protein